MRNGALEDLENYAVGPPVGTIRAVGSRSQPVKSGRTKFTAQDDHELLNWVRTFEQRGGATSGNEIYKQLEAKVRKSYPSILEPKLIHLPFRILAIHGSRGGIAGSRL